MTIRRADTSEDRAACWSIRETVFIREQGVPEDVERDDLDGIAQHLIAVDPGAGVVGTARVLFLDRDHQPVAERGVAAKIGRMAVVAARRRRGVGRALLDGALAICQERAIGTVELSAQQHAIGFYAAAGFRAEGEPYLEAGIPHRRMTMKLVTHDEAMDLFDRRRAAWLAGDLDAYLALWADDMSFQSPAHAEPLVGKAAFAELIRMSFSFSKPLSFDFHTIAVHGRRVLAEWTIAIERRDSGRRVEWRGMSTAEIDDGRITFWREYWNPADLAL